MKLNTGMKKNQVLKLIKSQKVVVDKATIYRIDGSRVDIRIGTAPNLIRNVECASGVGALYPGMEVGIMWVDGRPRVLSNTEGVAGPAGASGTPGTAGVNGVDGVDGAQGPKGANWRGAYDAGTAYLVDDLVSYNGSTFICIEECSGNLPTSETYWSLFASRGDQGVQGIQGLQGDQGIQGEQGIQGPAGPSGAGYPADGRLTLESGVPVSITDQLAKTTLYYTPYQGNMVALYNGSAWDVLTFSQLSLTLSGYTAGTNYDIFAYNNAGVVTLESLVWSNDTTRATALVRQDGVLVKSGAVTRRYLGTIHTANSNTCEDSAARRFVWNYYHRVLRILRATDPTDNWTYTTNTWRPFNNSTVDGVGRVAMVIGVEEEPVLARELGAPSNTTLGVNFRIGIGLDSTNSPLATLSYTAEAYSASAPVQAWLQHYVFVEIGYHFISTLEYSGASGTTTWRGDGNTTYFKTGLMGEIRT